MDNPLRHQGFSCAVQHGLRSMVSSLRGRASDGFRRRFACVLLGVALLGAASAVREFDVSIRDRRVEGSASTLRVKRGETVLLHWRTDEAVSLHLHGYDVQAYVPAASPRSMRFEAGIAGRFPVTAHEFGTAAERGTVTKGHREVTLLYLEVLPE